MTGYTLTSEPVLRVYCSRQGRRYLPVDELLSMQSEANYTWLLLRDGERILLPRTLKYLEGCLPQGRFVRLNRHFSVHVDTIKAVELKRYNQLIVHLKTGEQIAVARRRIAGIKQLL